MFDRMRRNFPGTCSIRAESAPKAAARSDSGKENGQTLRGRAPPDVNDELARIIRQLPLPGVFGVFYQHDRPTPRNSLRKEMDREQSRENGTHPDLQLLQKKRRTEYEVTA